MTEKMYLDHADIEALGFVIDEYCNTYAVRRLQPIEEQDMILVFSLRTAPSLEFTRLLNAAPKLYQCLTSQALLIEMILRDTPATPKTEAVLSALKNMRQLTKLAQDAAINGVEASVYQSDSTNRTAN